jgi:hypothetical protein
MLPLKISPLSRRPIENYDQSMRAMCEEVAHGRAIIVYFKKRPSWSVQTVEALEAGCHFDVSRRFADGRVLGSAPIITTGVQDIKAK